jgi:hypothetical protein
MKGEAMTAERGLVRVRQIAAEELAAIHAGDEDRLCCLTELVQPAIEGLRQTGLPSGPDTLQILEEIRLAHVEVERFLEEQMREVRLMLQQCSTARTTLRAYGAKGTAARFDNRS